MFLLTTLNTHVVPLGSVSLVLHSLGVRIFDGGVGVQGSGLHRSYLEDHGT